MIDWKRVADLRDEIGSEDFEEVLPLFLEEVLGVMDTLRDAPDLSRLEEDMHFLKGAALNLGFEAFTNLCSAGEIIDCFEASRATFDAGLAQGAAA